MPIRVYVYSTKYKKASLWFFQMSWTQVTTNFGNPWQWKFVFMAIIWESVITTFWCEVINCFSFCNQVIPLHPHWGIERDKNNLYYVLEYSCVLERVGLWLLEHWKWGTEYWCAHRKHINSLKCHPFYGIRYNNK